MIIQCDCTVGKVCPQGRIGHAIRCSIWKEDPIQSTDSLFNERRKTHGDYSKTAFKAQEIKTAMRSWIDWSNLDYMTRESLEMIATKIARILQGNEYAVDHWRDLAGYATLIVERLSKCPVH